MSHVEAARMILIKLALDSPVIKNFSELPTSSGIYFVTKELKWISVTYHIGQHLAMEEGYRLMVGLTPRKVELRNNGIPTPTEIVYVGQSDNLRKRWNTHSLKKMVKNGEFQLRWKAPDTKNFQSIKQEEASFISLIDPILNKEVSGSRLSDEPLKTHHRKSM